VPVETPKYLIYAVSDATGQLAASLSFAAARQFNVGTSIQRRPRTSSPEKITDVVREARDSNGLIVFTLVSDELRQLLLKLSAEARVTAIDIMGPLLENLARHLQSAPSDQPGLQYRLTAEYYRRNEAVEFTVKHDDSLGLDSLPQADIILLGISRTSKTPLSIYLAYRGFKVANVPIVDGVPPPRELRQADTKKMVGLTILPEKLVELRGSRLTRMGKALSEEYASPQKVRQELAYAHQLFKELGNVPVIDVTYKAIEEVASEVLTVLGR